MENGSATNAQPTNSTRVLPRRKEPVIDSETANNKRIKRLTLKLEEIERERYQVLNMSKKSFYHALTGFIGHYVYQNLNILTLHNKVMMHL